jgi:hypothetical protein
MTTNTTEESFWISEAKPDPNIPGRFIFKFPEHWRNIVEQQLNIGVRSIRKLDIDKLITLQNIKYYSGFASTSTAINYNYIIPRGKLLAEVVNTDDVTQQAFINYDSTTNELTIRLTTWDADTPQNTQAKGFTLKEATISDDLCNLVGVSREFFTDLSFSVEGWVALNPGDPEMHEGDLFIKYAKEMEHVDIALTHFTQTEAGASNLGHHRIKWIKFKNVFSLGAVKINSSIVDNSVHQYLGFTDSVYYPPKMYTIHKTDQLFWVDLVDLSHGNTKFFWPGRDDLVIEVILFNGTKRYL